MRLRSTAFRAHFLEIAKPNLAKPKLLRRANTVTHLSVERWERRNTSSNSFECRKRIHGRKRSDITGGFEAGLWNSLGGQPSPPFRAARLENQTPPTRFHSCPKAVTSLALDVARLKGSFHDGNPKDNCTQKTQKRRVANPPRPELSKA